MHELPRDPPMTTEPDEAAFRAVSKPALRAPLAFAVGALTVLAVAVLTRQAVPDPVAHIPSTEPPAAPTAPSAAPMVADASSPAARTLSMMPIPELELPAQNDAVVPRPTLAAAPTDEGPAALAPAGAPEARLTLTVPDGWLKAGDSMVLRTATSGSPIMSISAWDIEAVHVFPCRWSAGVFASQALMTTARGQSQVLSGWWGQDPGILPYWNSDLAPLATSPVETTFDGRPAWYTAVLITRGFDQGRCDGGQLLLWEGGDQVRAALPGELHELFIVDIDRGVIVIDSTSTPTLSADELGQLRSVLASIELVP